MGRIMSTAIDVDKVLTFDTDRYVFKRLPILVGVVILGVVFVAVARASDTRQGEGIVLGSIVTLFGLFAIARSYYRRAHPLKPNLQLSPDGVILRIGKDKEFRIPWNEIQDLGQTDIRGRGYAHRNVTVALLSGGFFDANLPMKPGLARGSLWRYHFIPGGDVVQVAFHHEFLSISAEELWAEIEARWRAFRGQQRTWGRHAWTGSQSELR